jgi:hypothetical protein
MSFFCYRGTRSLEAGAKYGASTTPLPSLGAEGGDEDTGADDGDEGKACGRRDSSDVVTEAGEGHRAEEVE